MLSELTFSNLLFAMTDFFKSSFHCVQTVHVSLVIMSS